jgi:hypothetical protein
VLDCHGRRPSHPAIELMTRWKKTTLRRVQNCAIIQVIITPMSAVGKEKISR